MNWLTLSSFLCLLIYVKEGVCLNCYQCESTSHPDCKEYFDYAHMDSIILRPTECSVDGAAYCVKTTGVWGGVVGTTRFCSSRDMGNQCQYIRYPDHDRVYRACIYTCTNNDCNSAPGHVQVTTPLLALSVLVTMGIVMKRL